MSEEIKVGLVSGERINKATWDAMEQCLRACLAINPDNPVKVARNMGRLIGVSEIVCGAAAPTDFDPKKRLYVHKGHVDDLRALIKALKD